MLSIDGASRFSQIVSATFGEIGRTWLDSLPNLLEQITHNLKLTPLQPYSNLTYHYVAPAIGADGRNVVLKLGVPNNELAAEIRALKHFDGRGSVNLIYSDPDAGIMVQERLVPGVPLTGYANDETDSQATSIAAKVMRSLHRECEPDDLFRFQSVTELGMGFQRLRAEFGGGVGPFPERLVEEAERLWLVLDSDTHVRVLLHGDLHHDNIISASRSPWLAIDPKGYIGDAAFDTGPVLRNLWKDRNSISDPAKTIQQRVSQFADELEFEPERIRGWALAQAVLSVWWLYEDGDPDWADSLGVAEMISRIPE